MFKNILLSYDGSEHARKAATLVRQLAREQSGTVVYIVNVADDVSIELGEPFRSQLIEERTIESNHRLDEAEKILGEGLEMHRERLFGTPAEGVISVAETRGCDLIVMGTRGLGPLQGLLLGSQTQRVISMANCPVLAVK
jgi:nucleotide-binding universal stress UspA family protein